VELILRLYISVSQPFITAKITWEKKFKGGKIASGLSFPSIITWPHCCGPVGRQGIMVERMQWSKVAHLMVTNARSRDRQEGPRQDITLQYTSPVIYFLHPSYTFSIMPPNYTCSSGLIYRLGQGFHDPVTSRWLDPPAGGQHMIPLRDTSHSYHSNVLSILYFE
jgi:hypothetical protein